MTSAGDALRAGDLAGALAIATTAVKAAPTDADARWLMAELLLLSGDAERADRMLDAATLHEPNLAVLEFRRLLRAELQRVRVLREGGEPKYQGEDAVPAQKAALRARMLLRLGDVDGANQAAAEAEEQRGTARGRMEAAGNADVPFDDLRDADDLLCAEFEVLTTAGDYLLVPVSRVRSLSFDAPRRARDLAWRRCAIELKDGTEGVVYMPSLYVSPRVETDDGLLLGRETDWTDPADGPVRGRGQRMLVVAEEAVAFNTLHRLEFE